MSGRQQNNPTKAGDFPRMGLHPEQLSGTDSAAAGGATERGLAGLDPRKLADRNQETVGQLVEIQIDGSQVMVGVFDRQEGAMRAIDALQAARYDPHEVNVLNKEGRALAEMTREQAPGLNPFAARASSSEPESERMEGQVEVSQTTRANLGTGLCLLTGAAAGAAIGLAALSMPGLRDLFGDLGPWPAMLGGAAIFAAVGAWAGSLAGVAIPEEDANIYDSHLDQGYWLVAVRSNRIDQTFALLRDAGALNLQEEGPTSH